MARTELAKLFLLNRRPGGLKPVMPTVIENLVLAVGVTQRFSIRCLKECVQVGDVALVQSIEAMALLAGDSRLGADGGQNPAVSGA